MMKVVSLVPSPGLAGLGSLPGIPGDEGRVTGPLTWPRWSG